MFTSVVSSEDLLQCFLYNSTKACHWTWSWSTIGRVQERTSHMLAVWFCKGGVSDIDWFNLVTDISIVLLNAGVDEVKTKEEKRMRKYLFTCIQTPAVEVFLRAHYTIGILVSLPSLAILWILSSQVSLNRCGVKWKSSILVTLDDRLQEIRYIYKGVWSGKQEYFPLTIKRKVKVT
jgi:hypothetical protein